METILIVDDQEICRLILGEFVEKIGNVRGLSFDSPLRALQWSSDNAVSMVIVDYRMPGIDGIEFTRRLHGLPHCRDVPVVMISVVDDPARLIRYRALEAGVLDFLPKPIDYAELMVRCRRILQLRRRYREDPLHDGATGVLYRISQSFNGRDPWRVAGISRRIAEHIGLSVEECNLIERAAPMNDLGHVVAPVALLSRPAGLGQNERAAMQQHTVMGYQLLRNSSSELFSRAAKIALSHHERFDGLGYPHGFRGRDITQEARIVAVADFIDALLSDRPYRKAWPVDRVLGKLQSQRGKRFDPDCVDACLWWWNEIVSPD